MPDGDGETPRETHKTLVLDPAIEVNGKRYDAVELREPTLSEMISAQKSSGLAATQELIRLVSGLPPLVVARIPISQALEADEFFGGFMRRFPPTG